MNTKKVGFITYLTCFSDHVHKLKSKQWTSMDVMIMGYILIFLFGFGLAVSGGVTLIAYLNFLPAGITWIEYLLFIKGRIECYFLPIGILMMFFALSRYPHDFNNS